MNLLLILKRTAKISNTRGMASAPLCALPALSLPRCQDCHFTSVRLVSDESSIPVEELSPSPQRSQRGDTAHAGPEVEKI